MNVTEILRDYSVASQYWVV